MTTCSMNSHTSHVTPTLKSKLNSATQKTQLLLDKKNCEKYMIDSSMSREFRK